MLLLVWVQLAKLFSSPVQPTYFIRIRLLPRPKYAYEYASVPNRKEAVFDVRIIIDEYFYSRVSYWHGRHTYYRIPQLSAHHTGIVSVPATSTDCTPHSTKADFHPALSGLSSTPQANLSLNRTASSFNVRGTNTTRIHMNLHLISP